MTFAQTMVDGQILTPYPHPIQDYGPFQLFNDDELSEGIHWPYIYFGTCHSSFPWHREDMSTFAVNHLLWGNDKLWFTIDPEQTELFMDYIRRQYEGCPDLDCELPVQHKRFWIDPYALLSIGIDVRFIRQRAGEIVINPPGGIHCGVNTGPNIAESANFMTWDQDLWHVYDSAAMYLLRARNISKCLTCEDHWYCDVRRLVQRLRNNDELSHLAPSEDIVPRPKPMTSTMRQTLDEFEESELITPCYEGKEAKDEWDERIQLKIKGEKYKVYPTLSNTRRFSKAKQKKGTLMPAVYCEIARPSDTLNWEPLYRMKFMNEKGDYWSEWVSENQIRWNEEMDLDDFNARGRFNGNQYEYWYPVNRQRMTFPKTEVDKEE